MILSVDPGEKRIGMAVWRPNGEFVVKFTLSFDEALHHLSALGTSYTDIVFEDFRLRQGKAIKLSGSRMETTQIIGAIKMLCLLRDMRWHVQGPDKLRLTALHANVELGTGHIPDDMSAYLHGYYWFETQGILRSIPTASRV